MLTRYCAGPCLLRMLQQTFAVQNKPAVAPKPSPSFLRFWNWAERSLDAAKICGGAENVVKTEAQQTFVNGLLGFITLGIYTPGSACAHNNCMSCPSIWATLSALLINILLEFPSSCFLHSDQPLWGEIIPFSSVCQSGEAALSTPEAVVASHWLTDCWYATGSVAATSTTQSIIFSFSIS